MNSKTPVGIRAAIVGGIFVILAAIITVYFQNQAPTQQPSTTIVINNNNDFKPSLPSVVPSIEEPSPTNSPVSTDTPLPPTDTPIPPSPTSTPIPPVIGSTDNSQIWRNLLADWQDSEILEESSDKVVEAKGPFQFKVQRNAGNLCGVVAPGVVINAISQFGVPLHEYWAIPSKENLIAYLTTADGKNDGTYDMEDFCLDSPGYAFVAFTDVNNEVVYEKFSLPFTSPMMKTISAKKGWQPTGIVVKTDELLTIQYLSGDWTGKTESPGRNHGEDSPMPEKTDECYPIKGQGSSLVGRIGAGQPFVVGEYFSVHIFSDGELELRMNDCENWLEDNEGAIKVVVDVEH